MPHIKPNDGQETFEVTEAQFKALQRKFEQDPNGSPNFAEFRARARYCGDYIMIHWCGMWLGIEPDGYTHS
jgi:hypothetical protein